MELQCGLGFKNINVRVCTEREGARTADGVDRAQAASRFRKELQNILCMGFLVFPWFPLVSGDQR